MVFFNWATMQMAAKIVYYGPGLCGKTSNLSYIYAKTSPNSRGEMVSLETESDRTLFFDLLPIEVGTIGGFKTRLQLYTVPGQVFYNTTRKLVLKGVDGLVFVADSQRPMREANVESFRSLAENIEELGLEIADLPLVLQYNKRDLQNVLSEDELNADLNPHSEFAYHLASAINGEGVFETLKEITKITLRKLRKRMASPQTEVTSSPPASTESPVASPTPPASQKRAISAASLARAAEEGVGHGLYEESEKTSEEPVDADSQESAAVAPEADELPATVPQEETSADRPVALAETPSEVSETETTAPAAQSSQDSFPADAAESREYEPSTVDEPEAPPTSPTPEDEAGLGEESDEAVFDEPEFADESEAEFLSEHEDLEPDPEEGLPADLPVQPGQAIDEHDEAGLEQPTTSDAEFPSDHEDDPDDLEEELDDLGDLDDLDDFDDLDDEVDVLEFDDPGEELDLPPADDEESPSPEETTAPSFPDAEDGEPPDDAEAPDVLEDEAPPEALDGAAGGDGEEDDVEFDTSAGKEIAVEPPPMKRVQISNQTDILAELDGLRRQATEAAPDRRRRAAQPSELDLDSLLSSKSTSTRDLKRRIEQSLNSNIFQQMRSVQLAFRIQDEDGSTIHTLEPISLDVDDVSSLENLVLQLTVDLENIR